MASPIENIEIGDSKKDVLNRLEEYKVKGVIDSSNMILLNGSKVKFSFTFCADCFDEKLQSIELRTTDNKKLISFLNDSILLKEGLVVKELVLKDIVLDSVVCIYSKKVKYYKELGVIGCKRNPNKPCWE